MAHVSLEQLTKTYRAAGRQPEFAAVRGIDLEVRDGEFLVLVGPSGCGKSTTLRMVAGLEEITSGTLRIDGRVVNDVPPKDRDIAMVFQNYALYPHLTVFENMAFGLRLRKFPSAEVDARVQEAAQLLGLEALLERKPKALSGGQRQRVAVGRAIVRRPKVFLFDEPLSNLDAKMRVAMRAEISRLHQRLQATMIYVTHDQVEAMTMANRICVMNEGRIVQLDEPLQLYHAPRSLFAAGFIGSPPMNLFRGTLRRAQGRLSFVEDGSASGGLTLVLPEALATRAHAWVDRAIVFGLRPEHIDLAEGEGAGATADVKIDLAEPLGAETFLHLDTGATRCVARVRPGPLPRPGDRIRIRFDLTRAHLFDATTQAALP